MVDLSGRGQVTWPDGGVPDWCLFLDRDGVINRRREGDYVRSVEDFEWLPGALEAVVDLSWWAPRLVVVTNQQGVGKGLMSVADLDTLHAAMADRVAAAGGRIDAVLACPHLASVKCACRKPRTGLADGWLSAHPGVVRERCVVVGDTWSDIAMGRMLTRGLGTCVWVSENEMEPEPVPAPDVRVRSLAELAECVATRVNAKETA